MLNDNIISIDDLATEADIHNFFQRISKDNNAKNPSNNPADIVEQVQQTRRLAQKIKTRLDIYLQQDLITLKNDEERLFLVALAKHVKEVVIDPSKYTLTYEKIKEFLFNADDTLLEIALYTEEEGLLNRLVPSKINYLYIDKNNNNLLHLACKYNNPPFFQRIFPFIMQRKVEFLEDKNNVERNPVTELAFTLMTYIHSQSGFGSLDLIKYILEAHTRPESLSFDNQYPLFFYNDMDGFCANDYFMQFINKAKNKNFYDNKEEEILLVRLEIFLMIQAAKKYRAILNKPRADDSLEQRYDFFSHTFVLLPTFNVNYISNLILLGINKEKNKKNHNKMFAISSLLSSMQTQEKQKIYPLLDNISQCWIREKFPQAIESQNSQASNLQLNKQDFHSLYLTLSSYAKNLEEVLIYIIGDLRKMVNINKQNSFFDFINSIANQAEAELYAKFINNRILENGMDINSVHFLFDFFKSFFMGKFYRFKTLDFINPFSTRPEIVRKIFDFFPKNLQKNKINFINSQNAQGNTFLHNVCMSNEINLDTIKYLLSNENIDLNVTDKAGNTPLANLGKRLKAIKKNKITNIISYEEINILNVIECLINDPRSNFEIQNNENLNVKDYLLFFFSEDYQMMDETTEALVDSIKSKIFPQPIANKEEEIEDSYTNTDTQTESYTDFSDEEDDPGTLSRSMSFANFSNIPTLKTAEATKKPLKKELETVKNTNNPLPEQEAQESLPKAQKRDLLKKFKDIKSKFFTQKKAHKNEEIPAIRKRASLTHFSPIIEMTSTWLNNYFSEKNAKLQPIESRKSYGYKRYSFLSLNPETIPDEGFRNFIKRKTQKKHQKKKDLFIPDNFRGKDIKQLTNKNAKYTCYVNIPGENEKVKYELTHEIKYKRTKDRILGFTLPADNSRDVVIVFCLYVKGGLHEKNIIDRVSESVHDLDITLPKDLRNNQNVNNVQKNSNRRP